MSELYGVTMSQDHLEHHGILGMKWGVRRYQNKDGSYTSAGRARYGIQSDGKMSENGLNNYIKDNKTTKEKLSKQYKKYATKITNDVNNNSSSIYVNAYNKAAEKMNNGLTDKYNSDYDKQLLKKHKNLDNYNYQEDTKYVSGYEKLFNDTLEQEIQKAGYDFITNNRNYKKAKQLCDRYQMTSFDSLARENELDRKDIEDFLKKYKAI